MSNRLLSKGQLVTIDGVLFKVRALLPSGKDWQLQQVSDQSLSQRSINEIKTLYRNGDLDLEPEVVSKLSEIQIDKIKRDLHDYSQAAQKECKRKYSYVKEAIAQGGAEETGDAWLGALVDRVALELGDDKKPCVSTLKGWIRDFKSAGCDARVLAPALHRKGNRKERTYQRKGEKRWEVRSFEVAEHLRTAIREFLRAERPKKQSIAQYVESYFANENGRRSVEDQLPVPSRATVYRWIRKLDPYERDYWRFGKEKADRLHRLKGRGPGASFPLERVEIDSTPLNAFAVHGPSGLALGRPWITVAIDYYSRAVLGFYLGFEPPSILTAMRCLRHAIAPKPDYAEIFGHSAYVWSMHGLPLLVVCDNAGEYRSFSMADAALQLGFEIQPHPVKWPWWKGAIERFLGTLNEGVLAWVPGKSFKNVLEKDGYDAQSMAVLTLDRLEELITKWIIIEYNTTRHEGIRDVPARLWDEGMKNMMPALPPRVKDLDVLLAYTRTAAITDKGIRFQNLFYRSEKLHELFMRADRPERVRIKIDDKEMSVIRVCDWRTGEYFAVPVEQRSTEYTAGLSLAEHLAVQKHRRLIAERYERDPSRVEARNSLRLELANLLGKKGAKALEKLRAARISAGRITRSSALFGLHDDAASNRSITESLGDEVSDNAPTFDERRASASTFWSGAPDDQSAGRTSTGTEETCDQNGRGESPGATEPEAADDPDDFADFANSTVLAVRKRPEPLK